jgi:CRP-like cAMP-binding protein
LLSPQPSEGALSQPTQSFVRNCLLSALPPQAYGVLRASLESVRVEKGDVLIEPDKAFDHVLFLERGIGSIVVSTADSRRVEAGIFGREGVSGLGAVLGVDRMSQMTIIQVAGDGYQVEVGALREALACSPELLAVLLRYVQVMMTQTSFTALSNVNQSVEERLARWLLMCHDRIDGDDVHITHEFLSIMLAVQRPSVTTALHMIEGYGFIRAKRGNITILDREALVEFADGTYGAPEAEYRRLIGAFR